MAATGILVAAVADPPAVAEPSALKHVPVCAQELAQNGLGPWKGVVMKAADIVLSGGFGGRCSHVAQSVLYEMDGQQWRFVHLHKHARWFLNGCGGPKAVKGDLPAVSVIGLLRERFFEGETAVAEEAPAVADPMDGLDDVLEEKPTEKNKPKINRKKVYTARSCVFDDA